MATLALRATRPRDPERKRDLIPAVDDADDAVLDRAALTHQRAAMIASLWPPARQCVVGARYETLPAPAQFGAFYRLSWPAASTADARALQARLLAAFPCAESAAKPARNANAAA